MKISGLVITHNSQKYLRACLESLKPVCDEIIVVDDRSTDDTQTIAKNAGAVFIEQPWLGYGPQKNMGADKANNDWILSIDSDEVLSPLLQANIRALSEDQEIFGYVVNHVSNYCGQWILHGRWFPDKHIRLYNRQVIRWNDRPVHEGLVKPEGDYPELAGYVLHYTIDNLAQHRIKAEKYASLGAKALCEQDIKSTFVKRFLNPPFRFIMDYIISGGFMDGKAGFNIARIQAWETAQKYKKLAELNK